MVIVLASVQVAVDVWSLGVMAFELLSGKRAFPVYVHGKESVSTHFHVSCCGTEVHRAVILFV